MDITLIQLGMKLEHARFLAEAGNSFNASQSCFRLDVREKRQRPANSCLKWPECARDFGAQNRKTIVVTEVEFDDNWFSHGHGSIAGYTSEWLGSTPAGRRPRSDSPCVHRGRAGQETTARTIFYPAEFARY